MVIRPSFNSKDSFHLLLVGGMILSLVLSSTAIFENTASAAFGHPIVSPPNKLVAKLGDKWWQWGLAIDTDKKPNPFTDLEQPGCDVGFQKKLHLLYLVGSGADENGNLVEHNCSVPLGTSILFPILNVACNTNDAPPFFGANEQEQRECSKGFIDKAFDLQVIIDGKELKHPEQYRLASPKGGFKFNAADPNPFVTPPGHGTGVSDGFWILTGPLSPGKHKIFFTGKFDLTDLGFGILKFGATYNLDAKAKYYSDDYLKGLASDDISANVQSPLENIKSHSNTENSNQPADDVFSEVTKGFPEFPKFPDMSSMEE
jgi:hypothetical protein